MFALLILSNFSLISHEYGKIWSEIFIGYLKRGSSKPSEAPFDSLLFSSLYRIIIS